MGEHSDYANQHKYSVTARYVEYTPLLIFYQFRTPFLCEQIYYEHRQLFLETCLVR